MLGWITFGMDNFLLWVGWQAMLGWIKHTRQVKFLMKLVLNERSKKSNRRVTHNYTIILFRIQNITNKY